MKPFSFDLETCREVIGDMAARAIEEKARRDADAELPKVPSPIFDKTHFGLARDHMRCVIYCAQYGKRLERNARKAAK